MMDEALMHYAEQILARLRVDADCYRCAGNEITYALETEAADLIGKLTRALQSRPADALEERGRIVEWLRDELTTVPRDGPDRAYRMGQNDALKLAIDAIARADHNTNASEG